MTADKPGPAQGALISRAVVAVFYAGVTLAAIYAGGWVYAALAACAAAGLTIEWGRLNGAGARRLEILPGLAVLGLALLAAKLLTILTALVILTAGFVIICLAVGVIMKRGYLGAVPVLYFGLPMICLIWLRELPQMGIEATVWLFATVWATDSGAYLFGKSAGGPKLAPSVSPSKTWSGAAGGILAALLIGWGQAKWVGIVPLDQSLVMAALISVAGQTGDLAESRVKRWRGVKDSGTFFRSHGGIMDRLDSLLFAAPVFALAVSVLDNT